MSRNAREFGAQSKDLDARVGNLRMNVRKVLPSEEWEGPERTAWRGRYIIDVRLVVRMLMVHNWWLRSIMII